MTRAFTIAGKEIRSYFSTPTAYVVLGVFAIISSWFFLRILEYFQAVSIQYMQMQATEALDKLNLNDAVLRPLYMNINVFFLLMIPVLTMRLIAEEKKLNTWEFLTTTPATIAEIVVGKYLAALFVVFCMLLIAALYPAVVALFGGADSIEWQPVLSGFVGVFLMSASFAALALFTSSVTESQIVSAIMGFGLLLLLWVIGWAASGSEGVAADVLRYLSVLEHVDGFMKGLIELKDVVFYLSFIFFGLFLTHRVLESQRWR